jgi:hypothetical protein
MKLPSSNAEEKLGALFKELYQPIEAPLKLKRNLSGLISKELRKNTPVQTRWWQFKPAYLAYATLGLAVALIVYGIMAAPTPVSPIIVTSSPHSAAISDSALSFIWSIIVY